MAGFVMGGGRCAVCKRGGCVPSFHSFEEQEAAERAAEWEEAREADQQRTPEIKAKLDELRDAIEGTR